MRLADDDDGGREPGGPPTYIGDGEGEPGATRPAEVAYMPSYRPIGDTYDDDEAEGAP
jgi:hypothetical protein